MNFRALFLSIFFLCMTLVSAQQDPILLDSAQRRHIELRYGTLLCFGMNTFLPGWGGPQYPGVDTNAFNPTQLCNHR